MRKTIVATAALLLYACGGDEPANRVVGELASDRIELTAEAGEPIVEIAVAEGARVVRGDLLLRQDAARAAATLDAATAKLAEAEARLAELTRGPRSEQIRAARAGVDGAERELEFRRSDFARIEDVFRRNLASQDTLDRAKAALDAAEANLDVRRAQLQELLTGTTVEELAQAEAVRRQALANAERARIDVERHTLSAPVDGIVDSRLFEVGERPVPGRVVMVMLAAGQPHARVYIPEALRVRVAAGTRARVWVDGLDEPIDGRVRWVSDDAAFTPYFALTERDRGRLTFAAKIDLDLAAQDRRLPDGVPVAVELLLE
ncbi:MAG: HlyD family efflux transporter periplasmic adaptor subunit [Woeseiaceae bacterium]|nr:HlyD family efflux transporter periplasmic adaptor subunit [Woeseiaceae bacterium]